MLQETKKFTREIIGAPTEDNAPVGGAASV